MVDTFQALAEPRRREILDALRQGERTVGSLADELALSQPGISKHLRVLRDAGVVQVRPVAQTRHYRVNPKALMNMHTWLESYRALWESNLDALEDELHRMSRESR